jgi:hypothetical protein
MPIKDIELAKLSTPVIPTIVPPALMSRIDRISGVRAGAIPNPLLRFSDLISGPATGLGDGLGSGVIVTLWGQGLGDTQGQVFFTDSLGVERPAAYIYYWKKADGQLPSGPANLWESHLMYEIAFSIPASASGAGTISIRKSDGVTYSNTLPFTVRTGRILWIDPAGDNTNAGTFASPKKYINGGDNVSKNGLGNSLQAGDTVYSRGVIEKPLTEIGFPADTYPQYAMFVRTPTTSDVTTQTMLVSYPNTRSEIQGQQKGFNPYLAVGVGLSKWKISVGHTPTSTDVITSVIANSHISTCKWGRYIANELTDKAGMCSTGQAGAIVSGSDGAHGVRAYGNYLHDIGCDGTSHFQHTSYFSIRDYTQKNVAAWEFSFNYLRDCKAKFGFHCYDQADGGGSGVETGNVVGTVKCNNNVFLRQKGAAISFHTSQTSWSGALWSCDFECRNNIMIECGKGPVAEPANGTAPYAMKFGDRWQPNSFVLEHNLVYRYSDPSSRISGAVPCAATFEFRNQPATYKINNNIVVSDGNFQMIQFGAANVATPTQAAYNAAASLDPTNTYGLPSGWTNKIENVDLKFSIFNTLPDVVTSSPMNVGASLPTPSDPYDFYGRVRGVTVGPVEVI